jgi:hypothetical protein
MSSGENGGIGEIKLDSQWSGVFQRVIEVENTGSLFKISLDQQDAADETSTTKPMFETRKRRVSTDELDGTAKRRKIDDEQTDLYDDTNYYGEQQEEARGEEDNTDPTAESWFRKISWGHWFDHPELDFERGQQFCGTSRMAQDLNANWRSTRAALSRHLKKRVQHAKKKSRAKLDNLLVVNKRGKKSSVTEDD